MGIELTVDSTSIEFRKELTLKHSNPSDEQNECLPEEIIKGKFYRFGIKGHIVFPLGKAILLFEGGVKDPLASIEITEQTNFLTGGYVHTRGEYYVRNCQKKDKQK